MNQLVSTVLFLFSYPHQHTDAHNAQCTIHDDTHAATQQGMVALKIFSENVLAFYDCWRTTSSGGRFYGTLTHADYRGDNFFLVGEGAEMEAIVVDTEKTVRACHCRRGPTDPARQPCHRAVHARVVSVRELICSALL